MRIFYWIEGHYQKLEEDAISAMGDLLPEKTGAPKVVRAHRRALSAAPAIVTYGAEEGIDLIVMGTHGRRGLRHFLLGSVAEEVVRTAAGSVLTLRRPEGESEKTIDRILVPVDFSSDSDEALEVAREVAATYGASHIDVVHVVALPAAPLGPGLPTAAPIHLDIARQARESLSELSAEASEGKPSISIRVLEGPAAWRIVETAEEVGADLIVLGSHGLSGLRRFLIGSVSERVVRWAHCPVWVLRRPYEEQADE